MDKCGRSVDFNMVEQILMRILGIIIISSAIGILGCQVWLFLENRRYNKFLEASSNNTKKI